MKANIQEMQDTLVQRAVDIYCQENVLPEEWDLDGLQAYFATVSYTHLDVYKRQSGGHACPDRKGYDGKSDSQGDSAAPFG